MMRSYLQFAIVQGDSAQQLTEKLNSKLYELRDKDPSVTFEGLTARIRYTEEEETEKLERGRGETTLKLRCIDCPMFEPVRKKDGTADRRMTIGFCPLAEDGHTLTNSRACQRLTEMINNREVRLCFKEER